MCFKVTPKSGREACFVCLVLKCAAEQHIKLVITGRSPVITNYPHGTAVKNNVITGRRPVITKHYNGRSPL